MDTIRVGNGETVVRAPSADEVVRSCHAIIDAISSAIANMDFLLGRTADAQAADQEAREAMLRAAKVAQTLMRRCRGRVG